MSKVMGFSIHFSLSVAATVRLRGWVRMPFHEALLRRLGCPDGVRVGSGVSEVENSLRDHPSDGMREPMPSAFRFKKG